MYEYADFLEDVEYSRNPAFQRDYDAFYKSDVFVNKYLRFLYKTNIPRVVEIIRSESALMQQEAYVDCLLKFSNGTTIAVDEKTDRPKYISSPNLVLELMSNPSSGYRKEGWAYHRGRYMSYSCSNETESGLIREPIFFVIDEDSINMFNRNKKYPAKQVKKKTNGLYASIIKCIPREDMKAFIRGELRPPKLPKNPTLDHYIDSFETDSD